jgi:Brp/Blh family beta-carotene 15,15'-monooxygenase
MGSLSATGAAASSQLRLAAPILASLPIALLVTAAPTHAMLVAPALVAIAVTIGHGALDVFLIEGDRRIAYGTAYLVGIAVAAATFMLAPSFALTMFLAVSILHFADSDAFAGSRLANVTERVWRGPMPIWLASSIEPESTADALGVLAADPAVGMTLVQIASHSATSIVLMIAFVVHLAALSGWRNRVIVAIEVVVLAFWFATAPLLVAFAAYFCCVHGWRHLLRARADRRLRADLSGRHGRVLLGVVLGISAVITLALPSAIGMAAARDVEWSRDIFVVLACFALPHAVVVRRWIRRSRP